MPGWEFVDDKEKQEINNLFKFKKKGIKTPIFYNGKKVKSFESKFANYVGSKFAICVTSGTAAIKIALLAAGIKPNDEVITQSFTFIAVVEAIMDVGAKPIITEVDETLNMCPLDLKKKITKKTKAIIPVHMLGVSAEVDKIKKIAKENNLVVIDDNCEALGAKWKNETLGNQFDMCAWSFDNGKTLTTGEGGMITTNNKKFYKYCIEYRDHGHENNPKFPRGRDSHKIFGFNYRVTEIVGALGIIQLKKLKKVVKYNFERYKIYKNVIKKFKKIKLRKIPTNNKGLCDCIIFNFENRSITKKFVNEIKKHKIITKNVPDALEWHFAKYWDHIFTKFGISKKKLLNNFPKSSEHLEKSVSIFIYATESLNQVKSKAKKIENILNKLF
jgi:8-amino-3,8-dideoxy-alpha-D-manno-octulosonate transaminase|tara:strand:+ start:212 stop:1372 length:1161 start_codon:yes stop_codon:yes gene_type:complete